MSDTGVGGSEAKPFKSPKGRRQKGWSKGRKKGLSAGHRTSSDSSSDADTDTEAGAQGGGTGLEESLADVSMASAGWVEELEATVKQLSEQNQQLKADLDTAESELIEVKAAANPVYLNELEMQIGSLRESCQAQADLQQSLELELDAASEAKTAVQQNLSKALAKNESLRAQVNSLKAELAAAKEQWCSEVEALKTEVADGEAKRKREVRQSEGTRKPADTVGARTLAGRRAELSEALNSLAASSSVEAQTALLLDFFKFRPELMDALKQSGEFAPKLSPVETIQLRQTINASKEQMRRAKHFLRELGADILAPSGAVQKEGEARAVATERVFELLTLPGVNGRKPFYGVNDLVAFLTERYYRALEQNQISATPKTAREIKIGFACDKGGSTTKLAFQFLDGVNPNSAKHLSVVSVYEADDNMVNMRIANERYADAFSTLKDLKLEYEGEQLPLKLFFIGDTKLICSLLGHQGSAAKWPCPWCYVDKAWFRTAELYAAAPRAEPRTMESIHANADGFIEAMEAFISRPTAAQTNGSIVMKPLFNVDLSNIPPPILHVFLGLGWKIFKLISALCIEIDLEHAGIDDAELLSQNPQKQCQLAAQKMTDLQQHLQSDEQLKEKIEQVQSALIAKQFDSSSECCSTHCIASELIVENDDQAWNECSKCSKWYHDECELVFPPIAPLQIGNRLCLRFILSNPQKYPKVGLRCSKLGALERKKRSIKELLRQAQSAIEQTQQEIIVAEHKFDQIQASVAQSSPCLRTLYSALSALGVDLKAYHGGQLVGNHLRKLLSGDGPDVLVECLASRPVMQGKIVGLLKCLGELQGLTGLARLLTPEEQDRVKALCSFYDRSFCETFPKWPVSRKHHFLAQHVPEFMEKHGTVGLFSEQACEALNALYNKLHGRYCSIRDPKQRHAWIFNEHHLYSAV